MIFLTVGHQMPFDRMIRIVDGWAAKSPGVHIFAQIGESDYRPSHFEFTRILARREFDAQLDRCSSVISHAGTGTIIQVLAKAKPLLVFPRLSKFAETRNDHQVGTARHFAASGQLMAAFDETQFLACLDRFQQFRPKGGFSGGASPELLSRLRCFLSAAQAKRSGESD